MSNRLHSQSEIILKDYYCGGYLISKTKQLPQEFCPQHNENFLSLADDHNLRFYFPDQWLFMWVHTATSEIEDTAMLFGFDLKNRPHASELFSDEGKDFYPFRVFSSLRFAKKCIRKYLVNKDPERKVLGIALHKDVADHFITMTKQPSPQPGHSSIAASGAHQVLLQKNPLENNVKILGFEILHCDTLINCFNSLFSLHFNVDSIYAAQNIKLNELGLIDSYEQAIGCTKFAQQYHSKMNSEPPQFCQWFPWLIVEYECQP